MNMIPALWRMLRDHPLSAAMDDLLTDVRGCTKCAADLPLGPRPVVRVSPTVKVLIVGQAPGTKVHESGLPFTDASGDRLRDWLRVDADTFYDERRIGIMPMGFCYPGVLPRGGDKPPRPECAPAWHAAIRSMMPHVELTVLVGAYAQKYYLGDRRKPTVAETVRAWREYAPDFFPTPHPSWRTLNWARKNRWFEDEVIGELRRRVHALI
jgi:uracil-DNA glycosylase